MTTSEVEVTRRRPIPVDTFAGRLKLTRLHAGDLTILEAAERCGLINQSWSNWERGGKPRDLLEVVEIISETLDVDFDWLLRGGALTTERRRVRTTAYALSRVIDRDRPQTSASRPSTYGASRRPSVDRPGMERQAVVRRRGAAR